MKITIENTWPEVGELREQHKTFTADSGVWDDDLDDALEMLAGLLKAYGFCAEQVDEAMGGNE